MGCGCNKNNKRITRPTSTPRSVRPVTNRPSEAALSQLRATVSGMTKEQREEERKKRIQAILKKKFQ